jgi:hypothetical protein
MDVVSMEAGEHHIGKDRPDDGNPRRLRRCELAIVQADWADHPGS